MDRLHRLWTPWRYGYVSGEKTMSDKPGVPVLLAGWPGNFECVFCNMIAALDWGLAHGIPQDQAEQSVGLLARGKASFLVLNAFPYNNGHIMVVPYKHESSLAALPWATAIEMLEFARRAESALRLSYAPDGFNMGLNLGSAAGAGIAGHLHLHAVPRWLGDTNYMTVLAATRILPEMLDQSWHRLRAALDTLAADESSAPETTSIHTDKANPL